MSSLQRPRQLRLSLPFTGLLLFGLAPSGCVLAGIEPEEIDIADGSDDGVSEAEVGEENGDGDPGGDGDGDGDPNETSTGDGDGDGDGDPSTGDGDGDPTGDGDGDPTGDGDGDGDGDTSCPMFGATDLVLGDNLVEIIDGASQLGSTCGGAGPESVYRFVAPSAGTWVFEIVGNPEFDEVLALVDSCAPILELDCSSAPGIVESALAVDQVVYLIVDSEAGLGTATVNVSVL